MSNKMTAYRERVRALEDWDAYLLQESGLPGPRGNLELAQAVAEEGDRQRFERYLDYTAERAPVNSPYEFLAFCGAVGLGRLLAEGDATHLERLRQLASDARWRMREAVAMALQRLGDVDMARLLTAMRDWATGAPLEQRAAAAALCEPRLLRQADHAREVLHILDSITATLAQAPAPRAEPHRILRQGLGYCWSVAVVAAPAEGKRLMEKWLSATDPDIQWIMRENLKKTRLIRMDPAWVQAWQSQTRR